MTAFKPKQGHVGRMTCKRYTAEGKVGIVMEGIRGDELWQEL